MRLSSIFASNKPLNPRRIALTFLAVIVTIILADYLAGIAIRKVTTQAPIIMSGYGSEGVEALLELSHEGVPPVVFTGSSQMQTAASPTVFNEQVKKISNETASSVNLSILGAVPTISRDLLRNLLIPQGVKTVFYGVESRAFHLNISTEDWKFLESPLGYAVSLPSGPEQSILLWLLEHSTFVRYRTNIHRWLSGQFGSSDPLTHIDLTGYWILTGIRSRDRKVIDDQFVPFKLDKQFYQSFQDILQTCKQSDIHCFILNMPMHRDSYQYIPLREAKDYKTMLYDTVRSAGFTLWDFDTEDCFRYFGDDGFIDLNHLNTDGAAKFTQRLALMYLNKLSQDSVACPEVVAP